MLARHAADFYRQAHLYFSQKTLQPGDHASKALVSRVANAGINLKIKEIVETADNDFHHSTFANPGRLWEKLTPTQRYDFLTAGLIADTCPDYINDANRYQALKSLLAYVCMLTGGDEKALTCHDMSQYDKTVGEQDATRGEDDVQQSSGQTGMSLRQLLATAQWTTVVVAVQKLLGDGDKWYTMIDNTLQTLKSLHSKLDGGLENANRLTPEDASSFHSMLTILARVHKTLCQQSAELSDMLKRTMVLQSTSALYLEPRAQESTASTTVDSVLHLESECTAPTTDAPSTSNTEPLKILNSDDDVETLILEIEKEQQLFDQLPPPLSPLPSPLLVTPIPSPTTSPPLVAATATPILPQPPPPPPVATPILPQPSSPPATSILPQPPPPPPLLPILFQKEKNMCNSKKVSTEVQKTNRKRKMKTEQDSSKKQVETSTNDS